MITPELILLFAEGFLSPPKVDAGMLSSSLSILSSMLTPAVLILASGSLIASTTSRFSRVIDHVRGLLKKLEELSEDQSGASLNEERRKVVYQILDSSTIRARILQRSVSAHYISLCMFVATSVSIGVITITHINGQWIPLVLGFTGAVLLFYGCVLMLIETRLAMKSVHLEMDFTNRLACHLK